MIVVSLSWIDQSSSEPQLNSLPPGLRMAIGMIQARMLKSFRAIFSWKNRARKLERAGLLALAVQIDAADLAAGVGKRRDAAVRGDRDLVRAAIDEPAAVRRGGQVHQGRWAVERARRPASLRLRAVAAAAAAAGRDHRILPHELRVAGRRVEFRGRERLARSLAVPRPFAGREQLQLHPLEIELRGLPARHVAVVGQHDAIASCPNRRSGVMSISSASGLGKTGLWPMSQ